MIVIMGATGRVGGAVLEALAGTDRRVRAISRHPHETAPGVDWVVADARDEAALASAFEGAEAVFVLNAAPANADDVFAEAGHLSVSIAAALRRAAVPYAVALSSQGAHLPEGTGIVATLHGFEQALRAMPTRVTFVRPAYFMESWVPLAQAAAASGALPAFLDPPSRAIETVSARDVGALAARLLRAPEPGIVNLIGPQRYSDEDVALMLTQLLGRPIAPSPVPAAMIAAAHEAVGIGASTAAAIAGLYAAINGTSIPFEDAPTHRGRTTLEEVIRSALAVEAAGPGEGMA